MQMDEMFGQPEPSMQLELAGTGAKGEQLMAAAADWIAAHPHEWGWMVSKAKSMAAIDGRVSIKYIVEATRHELRVSIPNALAPAFARIMDASLMQLRGKFKMHRSCADGFFPVEGRAE